MVWVSWSSHRRVSMCATYKEFALWQLWLQLRLWLWVWIWICQMIDLEIIFWIIYFWKSKCWWIFNPKSDPNFFYLHTHTNMYRHISRHILNGRSPSVHCLMRKWDLRPHLAMYRRICQCTCQCMSPFNFLFWELGDVQPHFVISGCTSVCMSTRYSETVQLFTNHCFLSEVIPSGYKCLIFPQMLK